MAKEAGYARSFEFDDLEEFASRAAEVMGAQGGSNSDGYSNASWDVRDGGLGATQPRKVAR